MRRCDAELAELAQQAAPYEAEYDRRLWNRYYLVPNHSGHVHRGTDCSTCYPTTRYLWIVDLAGCGEAEMVTDHGERACTVCFPDAPTHPAFEGPGRRDAEERARRELERVERAAIRAAKTLEPGLRFASISGDRVETVAAAKQALREVAQCRTVAGTVAYHGGYFARRLAAADDVETAAKRALAAKGVTGDEIDTTMQRAERKARKEWDL